MPTPLIETLTAVGLTDKEAKVFIALLALGEGSAAQIADKAEIKRTIVYFTLERLIERGYASELTGQKVRRFAAVPPMRLLQHVQANAENLRMMLPLLRALQQGREDTPQVELFEGKEAILPVYRSMECARHSYYLTCWDRLQEHFPEEVRRWSMNAAYPKNPSIVRNLIVDDGTGREMAKKMEKNLRQSFHVLPSSWTFDMNFGIADNTLAITSFQPLFVVVIRSRQVADCVRLLFELAWNATPPLKQGRMYSRARR